MSKGKYAVSKGSVVDLYWSTIVSALMLLAATVWAFWTTLAVMANRWAHDPQYSHGYFVPLFALGLLWMRREELKPEKLRTSWWGLLLLLVALTIRLAAAHYYFEWFDFLSLLPALAGICLLLGGWHALRWSWPAIGFMFFMIPLPYTLEILMRDPLRRIGTAAGVYLMQTLGLPAWAQGNVIVVEDFHIGVAEACSGLRMLMIFFALSTAVALISNRPFWERIIVFLSAVPIALFANILRITVTGALHATVGTEIADLVYHDLAGWLMMPLAVILLWFELCLLSRVFLVDEERPMIIGLLATEAPLSTAESTNKVPSPH